MPIYWTVLNIKLCKIEVDIDKFVSRNLLAKRNVKKTSFISQFNQFLGDEIWHSPNERVNCDLRSPDNLDIRLGVRASANVQHCD